jgi:ribonuclease HII
MLKNHYISNILEAGIDEAGRGPLFGRIYAAAVILPKGDMFDHSLMKDSKKLSSKKREIAALYIKENAIDYGIAYSDEGAIDRDNIFNSTQQTMHKALHNLDVVPDHLLVDGPHFATYLKNNRLIPFTCIEGGDNLYTPIAAASILAKVERDKYIEKMCDVYPELDEKYGLRKNKGYGTKQHMEGIKKYGTTKWHRKTFGLCKFY